MDFFLIIRSFLPIAISIISFSATAQQIPGHHSWRPDDIKNFTEKFSQLSFMTIEGNILDKKEWNNKILIINFWFTACKPCRSELPDLNRLVDTLSDRHNIIFLSLSPLDDQEQLIYAKKKWDIKYTLASIKGEDVNSLNVMKYPTNVVLYKNRLLFINEGFYSDTKTDIFRLINQIK